MRLALLGSFCLLGFISPTVPRTASPAPTGRAAGEVPAGWTTASPREEIRPRFSYDSSGGPKKDGAFVIASDDRAGLHGWFAKTFPVAGGKHYHVHAVRRVRDVAVPR